MLIQKHELCVHDLKTVYKGINYNVDELLVGILSQLKLRKEKSSERKKGSKVNI